MTSCTGWDAHVHVFDASTPVRHGHYPALDGPLDRIETLAQAHGVRHLVLVQPSVYGSDNTLLLRALAVEPGRHRGVVVLGDEVSDAELDAMHTAGVRGARLNLVSPVGEAADPARRFATIAPHLVQRGWHLQWYTPAVHLPLIAALHQNLGRELTCVLDHLGGLGTTIADDHPAWRAVEALADSGAWLKLSGWYRLDAPAPYHALVPRIRRLATLFGERMVWGSDWPHTGRPPEATPRYAEVWQPVVEALGETTAHDLRQRHPPIYG